MPLAVANLPCDDLARAKAFYVGQLGFNLIWEGTEDGHFGICGLELDGMRINLDAPMDGHGRNVCVSLEVDDVDSLFDQWAVKIGLTDKPQDQDWGARTFGFSDPDNNTVFVLGPSRG